MDMKSDALRVLTGVFLLTANAHAWVFSPAVGGGMQYTDNARLTPTMEVDDWIATGYLTAGLARDEGALQANASATIFSEKYLNDSYGDQDDLNINAVATWEQIPGRLVWQVDDYFTQTSVDSLGERTPSNAQDTNAFSIGATLTIPVSGRNVFTLNPVVRDFTYEETDTDNRSHGLLAGWRYLVSPAITVGVDGTVTSVEYDNETANPGYTRKSIQAVLNGTGGRTEYQVRLGATEIDRDQFSDVSGSTGNVSLLYRLTQRSSIDARVSSTLSDTSEGYFNVASDPDGGGFNGLQVSGDILRTDTVRVTFVRADSAINTRAWAEYNEYDYEQLANDRSVQAIGFDLSHPISPQLTSSVFGTYNRIKDKSLVRTDKTRIIGGNLNYRLSRSLTVDFELRLSDRESNDASSEYKEVRGILGLVYGFGRQGAVPRTGRNSRY